jgi:hypothetical protein
MKILLAIDGSPHSQAAIDEVAQRDWPTGTKALTITAKTLEGVPHEVIVREAEDLGADLIVLGSHGYGPIRRAILGSVAAAVAVEAPCAVEIIRSQRPPVKATESRSVAL